MTRIASLWAAAVGLLASTATSLSLPVNPASNLQPLRAELLPRQAGCGENTETNRKCWKNDWSINTDYEKIAPTPPGDVKVVLRVHQGIIKGDGFEFMGMKINDSYPGPPIIANWGDNIEVTIINDLQNGNGTSIHWHGLRQFESFDQDGVPGVTQCPIMPGQSMTYRFKATQYGTSWYHSHFSLQYTDGIAGPIIINGPTSKDYEEDLGALMVTDWYHRSAFSLFQPFELQTGAPPPTDSKLLNGKWGNFTCPAGATNCGQGEWFRQRLTPGKTYKCK